MTQIRIIIPAIAAALALSSPIGFGAEEEKKPGKASDAVEEPKTPPAKTTTNAAESKSPEKEPGKTSDPVKEDAANKAGSSFKGKITAIDKEAKTVTLAEKAGARTIHLGEDTKLMKGKKEKASWDDLKVGSEVQGKARKDGEMDHAVSVRVGS